MARVAGLTGIAVVALVALSGCSVDDVFYFGWPKGGITDQSQKMFNLWIGSVIAALAVGVFVWGLIFWCVVRYRKRGDELPPQTRYNMPLEMLYSVLPFLVIAVLFYYTAITETDVNKVSAHPDVTVQVEAFKWNWRFTYPDAKDASGQPVSTIGASDYIPVLVVPTNRTVLFKEHSADVIHSFWVPELLFKRDVFPGNVHNAFQVTIVKEGAYVGRCAELCGTYHSMMNFELRAVSDRGLPGVPQGQAGRAEHAGGAAVDRAEPVRHHHRAVRHQAHRRQRRLRPGTRSDHEERVAPLRAALRVPVRGSGRVLVLDQGRRGHPGQRGRPRLDRHHRTDPVRPALRHGGGEPVHRVAAHRPAPGGQAGRGDDRGRRRGRLLQPGQLLAVRHRGGRLGGRPGPGLLGALADRGSA